MEKGTHTFTFMGTAAGCGIPAFFCDCPACNEARRNPRARRGDCGVMVRGANADGSPGRTVLIDTPPDVRHQLIREDVRTVDELLFTHAHFDHMGGLGELEYLVQLVRKAALPTYGSAATLEGIGREFHYMTGCLDMREIQPLPVHRAGQTQLHGPAGDARTRHGCLIETRRPACSASVTGKLPPETAERVRGMDIMAHGPQRSGEAKLVARRPPLAMQEIASKRGWGLAPRRCTSRIWRILRQAVTLEELEGTTSSSTTVA